MNPVISHQLHLQESGVGTRELLSFNPRLTRLPRHVSEVLSAYHDQPAPSYMFVLLLADGWQAK